MKRRHDQSQKLLPFDAPPADAPPAPPSASHAAAFRYQPSQEALDALSRLQAWLTDPNTGRMTPLGQDALHALQRVTWLCPLARVGYNRSLVGHLPCVYP